jgi:hypothetical protein
VNADLGDLLIFILSYQYPLADGLHRFETLASFFGSLCQRITLLTSAETLNARSVVGRRKALWRLKWLRDAGRTHHHTKNSCDQENNSHNDCEFAANM